MYFFADQGGDRVAWSKQWIASPDIWTYRANFDSRVRTFPGTVLYFLLSFDDPYSVISSITMLSSFFDHGSGGDIHQDFFPNTMICHHCTLYIVDCSTLVLCYKSVVSLMYLESFARANYNPSCEITHLVNKLWLAVKVICLWACFQLIC